MGGARLARSIIVVVVVRNRIDAQRRAHRRTVLALAPRRVLRDDCPAFRAVARNRGAVERPLVPSPPSARWKIDNAVA